MMQGLLVLGLVCGAQDQPPTDQQVRDVLRQVREQVAAEQLAEQDQALRLAQEAAAARRAGQVLEAAVMARRALRQFPDSLPLRRLVRSLEADESAVKKQTSNLTLARRRLDEALDEAAKQYRQGDTRLARDLAEAVLTAAERFPDGFEVLQAVLKAEAFLKDPNAATVPLVPEAESLPIPPDNTPPPPPAPLPIPSRQLLTKFMTVDWQQVTLMEALHQIANETGVQLRIDPLLARLQVFDRLRFTWQAHQQPAERLLRKVMSQCGTDYVPMNNGQVYITTKQEAVAMILERRTPPAEVVRQVRPAAPAGPEQLPLPEEDTPAYFQSGKAFLEHIDALLKAAPAKPNP